MENKQLNTFIPLMSPCINEEDINEVVKVLKSGMLVQGEHVLKLECEVAKYTNVSECIAVSNGTATMHLALLASGIGKGDEVIVPAFSYVATANVVEIVGATPVFVDIHSDTFNVDEGKIAAAITSRTKAILPVHEFGLACNIEKIMGLAKQYNLIVIEDAACALGAKEKDRPVGSWGDFGSFSLHPRKSITSGEGGLIVTNNQESANQLRSLRNHGINPLEQKMEFIHAGYNYRLTEMQAALVHSQLKRLDAIISYKQDLADVYMNELVHPLIKLPSIPENKNHTWQTFHVVIDPVINRENLIIRLKENGIGTNYGAQCIPEQKFYKQKYDINCRTLLPNALRAFNHGLAIPLYNKLSKSDIQYISLVIKKVIDQC